MKENKQLSTGRRIASFIGVLAGGAVLGMITGIIAGSIYGEGWSVSWLTVDNLLNLTRLICLLCFILVAVYMYLSHTEHGRYELTDEADEEAVDDHYRKTFRYLEFATVAYNIAVSLTLFNFICSWVIVIEPDMATLTIHFFDIAMLLVLLVAQVLLMKLTQKIRNYKLSAFPTIKEIKAYMDSYDEGEKEANYEQSYLIVFNLNQYLLPELYIILYLVSILTQELQLAGLLVVASIHIYINLANLRMIKRYFK